MLFVEPRYVLFFALVAALYWTNRSNTVRKTILLLASYAFYSAWDVRFLSLIIVSTLVDYTAALAMTRSQAPRVRKAWLGLSLVVNLSLLGFFKYFNFFVDSFVDLMATAGVTVNHTTLSIILPVGISFYTFQTLTYSIDVYRGRLEARRSLLDIALFVGFFPQLVAGPIVRAMDFLPQLDRPRRFARVRVAACLTLFLAGFFKKAVVSDSIAPYVDQVFAQPELYTALSLITGVFLYAVQIYCDFSGYSDMAIASAGLLGFRLPVNFNAPYLATSISDFWRRWHISLSSWLRDYLYIPLGGNRGGRLATHRNLMITMLLGGLWHGAAWQFVVWGLLHGFALAAQREWQRWRGKPADRNWAFTHATATFLWVCLAWVFFRAESFDAALAYLAGMSGLSAGGAMSLPAGFHLVLPAFVVVQFIEYRYEVLERFSRWPTPAFAAALGACVAVALALLPLGYRPFIYFQF